MASLPRPRLTPSPFGPAAVPIWGGLAVALLGAVLVAVLPEWRLESLVEATALPRLLPSAQPPLGTTARALLAALAALVGGAVTWSALFLLWGPGGAFRRAAPRDGIPAVRRADAHPDAPPRMPMTAAELGTPPPPPAAERDIPADLDQPLAAFDPHAIRAVPMEPMRPLPSIATWADPATVREEEPAAVAEPPAAAAPAVASEPPPTARSDDPAPTLAALLDRLERGTRQRRG